MRRGVASFLLCAVAVLGAPSGAGAVTVAVGSHGRALIAWPADAGLQFAERTGAGRFTNVATIGLPNTYPAAAISGPGGAASVLAYHAITNALLLVRRLETAAGFDAPAPFVVGPAPQVVGSSSNSRGDAAVLLRPVDGPLVLFTAVRGGPLGSPELVGTNSDLAAVAVGADGRVAVAYFDLGQGGVHARLGTAGTPLRPVRRLSAGTRSAGIAAAIDDAGNTTVAYVHAGTDRDASKLVVRRAGPDGRFAGERVVVRSRAGIFGGFSDFQLAAAGTSTALAFDADAPNGRLGVAIARGGGRFARAQHPTAPGFGSFARRPFLPRVAVDRAGDVLLAYNYGVYGHAVHVTSRRAGDARFSAPRVISNLGHGGAPVAALLSDRTPLVAYDDGLGDAHYTTRLRGRRPDLTPPRMTLALPDGTDARLRASNAFDVRIRCSEACLVTGRATLQTPSGRSLAPFAPVVLPAGAVVVKRLTFNPEARAGLARDGSILRVTLDAENASGAARETVRQMRLR